MLTVEERMALDAIAKSLERVAIAFERIATVAEASGKIGGALDAIARLPKILSRI